MKNFLGNERGNVVTELMISAVIFSSALVVMLMLVVFDSESGSAKSTKSGYDGLKVVVTEEGVSGEKPRSVVKGDRAEEIAKLLTVSKSVKTSGKNYGDLDRTIDLTHKGKTVTFKVYAKNDTFYIVGDGTGVLKGVKGEKVVKVSGLKRDDVDNWMLDRSVLEGILADGW